MKYNLKYETSSSRYSEDIPNVSEDPCRIVIRVMNIKTGEVGPIADASGLSSNLEDVYESALAKIKTKLADLNISGVILPSFNQLKENEDVILSPLTPLPGSIISSDLGSLTPANILEKAIDKLTTTSNIPTSETVLSKETSKPSPNLTAATANVKPGRIEQPSPAVNESVTNSPDSTNPIVIEVKPIDVLVKPTDATSGKVTAAELDKAQPTPVGATTVNNTAITNSLPNQSAVTASNSSVNSSNLLINSGKSIMESINSVVNNSKFMESINSLTTKPKSTDTINSLTKNLLTTMTNAPEKSKDSSSNLSTLESSILSTFNEKSDVTNTKTDEVTNNLTQVKSSKLVESSNVKKILAPDKTLEKSVTSLSKSLPEAVNNLSNSVTSISPQTSNSTSIMNEGTKIDQSNRTTVNTPTTGNTNMADSADSKPAAIAPGINNDYYLQAIYSALMSGKIKVTLGYQ